MSEHAKHFDDGKPTLQWIPYDSLVEITKVFDYGAIKYGEHGNYKKGMPWSKMCGSILRHVYRWMNGEDIDPESNCHHLAHAGACIMMLLYYVKHHPQLDDRNGDCIASSSNPECTPVIPKGNVFSRGAGIFAPRTREMDKS